MTRPSRRSEADRRLNAGIGHAILLARSSCDLSQGALAQRVGVHRSLLCRWESGQRMPNLPDLITIAAVTSVPVSDLVATAERFAPHLRPCPPRTAPAA